MRELLDGDIRSDAPACMASTGLSMWTFTTDSLSNIISRWQEYSGESVAVLEAKVPPFGMVRSIMIASPTGISIEIIERSN